jgi:hypothetical protein
VICLLSFSLIGLCLSTTSAAEPKQAVRAISKAESVLAVYLEDWGLAAPKGPAMILAAWPDGYIIWSGDRLEGGAPYYAARIAPKKVTALLARFDKDGLLADDKLNGAHFGPDSAFITVFVKSGKKQVKMESWHELFEASDNLVADDSGVHAIGGGRRLDVLRKARPEYLFYRFVWSETRAKLGDLVPAAGKVTSGRPVMKGGELSWLERP